MNRSFSHALSPIRRLPIDLDPVSPSGGPPPQLMEFLQRQDKMAQQIDQLTQIVVAQQNQALVPVQTPAPAPALVRRISRKPKIDRRTLLDFTD